jgi:hypothetical protein
MAKQSPRRNDDAARAGQFASTYMVDAGFAQLVGLCRGILADGKLDDAEIVTLDQWLATYGSRLPEWPCQALAKHVKLILSDGLIDDGERADLLRYLEDLTGGPASRPDAPTTLPLTDPAPHVEYAGRTFCLTGTFVFGPRRLVITAVQDQGGRVIENPSSADYLVIGATITPSWKYSTHGLKIEKAVTAREESGSPAIVSEEHWAASLC